MHELGQGDGRYERGQTFPVWLFGILTALALLFFLINYANVLRWQIRAQSAADAAAAGAMATQSNEWNQMLVLLYAASVEEWRLRRLSDMLLLSVRASGGCYQAGTCAQDYAVQRAAYLKSLQRYTVDVELIQRVSTVTWSDYNNDAKGLVTLFQKNCGTISGGDCAFAYSLNDFSPRVNGLVGVQADALGFSFGDPNPGVKQDLQPAQLEVVVCHDVPPIIPDFFGLHFGSFRAIGRAAATTVLTTQEWLQPGSILNPWTNAAFQPVEWYEPTQPWGTTYDWYTVAYTGNDTQTYAQYGALNEQITQNEFTTFTGWWSSIPVRPYTGKLPATVPCS